MSGLPHTIVSSSYPVKRENRGTGTTREMPSLTAATAASNSCRRAWRARRTYSALLSAVTRRYLRYWSVDTAIIMVVNAVPVTEVNLLARS